MNASAPGIKCKKCAESFEPDAKTIGPWICPQCQAKNPNLRRHHRPIADLFMINFVVSLIIIGVRYSRSENGLQQLLTALQSVLLIVAVIQIYRTRAPWASSISRNLIWTIFGIALAFNVIVPLVMRGILNIPFLIIYVVVLSYMFWLTVQTAKCTLAPISPDTIANSGR